MGTAAMSFQHEMRATRPAPVPARAYRAAAVPQTKKQHKPFDPEDLSRRLYAVVAEREARAVRRRPEGDDRSKSSSLGESRMGRASDQMRHSGTAPRSKVHVKDRQHSGQHITTSRTWPAPNRSSTDEADTTNYRHVPSVAASQFTRTTSTDSTEDRTLVHQLSRSAIKFHKDGPNASHNMSTDDNNTAPCETTRAMKQTQIERQREYERNQFQHPSIMESAAEPEDRHFRLAQRHTFETHFLSKAEDQNEDEAIDRLGSLHIRTTSDPAASMAHLERQSSRDLNGVSRVDWTQSDEHKMSGQRGDQPSLRKSQSKWKLRGRFGNPRIKDFGDVVAGPETTSPTEQPQSPKALRPSKSSFFARFKR